MGDESGWKQIHGDVFRFISLTLFFCSSSCSTLPILLNVCFNFLCCSHWIVFLEHLPISHSSRLSLELEFNFLCWCSQPFSCPFGSIKGSNNRIQNTNRNPEFNSLLITAFVVFSFSFSFFGLFLGSRRGTIVTAFVVCYVLTSFIGGFVAASFYTQYGGKYAIRFITYYNVHCHSQEFMDTIITHFL